MPSGVSSKTPFFTHSPPLRAGRPSRKNSNFGLYVSPPASPQTRRNSPAEGDLGGPSWARQGGMGGENYQGRYHGGSNYAALPGTRGRALEQKPVHQGRHQSQSQQHRTSQSGRLSNQAQSSSFQFTSAGELNLPPTVQGDRQPMYTGYGYTASQQYDESALLGSGPSQTSGLPYQEYFPLESLRQQSVQRHVQPVPELRQNEKSQKTQQFSETNPDFVFGFSQSLQSQPSSYEVAPAGQSRQSASLVPLSPQFNVSQYFTSYEPVVTGDSGVPTRYLTPQTQLASFHQDQSIGRSNAAHFYPATMTDFNPVGTREGVEQQAETTTEANNLDEAYLQYQHALRSAFDQIRVGRLVEASRSILEISDWLVGNARELGLFRDEAEVYSDRLQLWNDFNLCWLALCQKQKDMTVQSSQPESTPSSDTSTLTYTMMEDMGEELIRLCDKLEPHGLVDYQMGIWEEEILSALTQCLNLVPRLGDSRRSLTRPKYNTSSSSRP